MSPSPNGSITIRDGAGNVLRVISADEALAAAREREAREREAQKPRRNHRPFREPVVEPDKHDAQRKQRQAIAANVAKARRERERTK
jgi:hypothetical protein